MQFEYRPVHVTRECELREHYNKRACTKITMWYTICTRYKRACTKITVWNTTRTHNKRACTKITMWNTIRTRYNPVKN